MNCPKCGKHPLPIQTLLGTAVVCCPVCGAIVKVSVELVEAPVPVIADDSDYDLVVDLQKPYVSYKGHQISTKPPHNIQPQPLRVLYILAKNSGMSLEATEIWSQMEEEGLLRFADGKPSSLLQISETKYLRQNILSSFRKSLNSCFSEAEINSVIETVSNPKPPKLRLNLLPKKVKCIGPHD